MGIACLLLPAAGWLVSTRGGKSGPGKVGVFLAVVGAVAVLHVARAEALNIALKAEVARYDRNGDGAFYNDEWTEKAVEAVRRYTSDTPRTFAPYVALPIALVWTLLCYAGLAAARWFWRWMVG